MNICVICNKEFEVHRNQNQKCCSEECRKEFKKEYDKNYAREYYIDKKEEIIKKTYQNRDRINKYKREHYKKPEVKERLKRNNLKYQQNNKVKLSKQKVKYYQENKDKIKEYHKKYFQENKKKINEYIKIRRLNDEEFAIKLRLRRLVVDTLKYYTKTGKIYSSKKYSIDYKEIIEHLKPLPENLKEYDIHHIKPLFTFNFINPDGSTNLEEIRKAFAPENHKLLTIEEHKKINHRNLR